MKLISAKILLFMSFLFLGSACEKIVTNVDLPDYQPKLVVQCFISPEDSNIIVYVSESSPIFKVGPVYQDLKISDATVRITGQGQDAIIPYLSDHQYYMLPKSAFPILSGATYTLQVSVPDGRSVSASTTVPSKLNTSLLINEINWIQGEFSDYEMNFRFQDLPGAGDFYRISAYFSDTDTNLGILNTYELFLEKGERVTSDLNKDENVFSYRVNYSTYSKNNKVTLLLLTTNEEYYRYHKTVFSYVGDDPFSEPVIIYSNIENGLGVFCAYRKFELDSLVGR